MSSRVGYSLLGIVGLVLWTGAGCPGPTDSGAGNQTGDSANQNADASHPTTLSITLSNDSCSTYISPKLGVCPKGMTELPHYFVDPPAILAPGESVTYTTDQVAGAADGDCSSFPTTFTVGIPGWGYGPTSNPDLMTYVETRFVGFIGTQFHCGDTIILHWSNCAAGGGAGFWTSEVVAAPGNPTPTASFASP